MEIVIQSNGQAQVVVNGKVVASVDAAISVSFIQDELLGTIKAFQKNEAVESNVDDYSTTIPNNVNTEPEILIADCEAAVVNVLEKAGFIVVPK